MKRLLILSVVVAAICTLTWAEESKQLSVATLPPVVVKTIPQAGDTEVDPSTTEIRATFSKKMMDKSWSWAGADESWINGKPHYLEDGKTCVLPVKLEPGKTYVVWLNSPSFKNFKDSDGRSSIPYLLVFETVKKSATASEDHSAPTAQDAAAQKEIEDSIRQYFTSMSKRDVDGIQAVLDTQLVALEATGQNARIWRIDVAEKEKLLPPEGNKDWINVKIDDVKVKVSTTHPSIAVASFALVFPLDARQATAYQRILDDGQATLTDAQRTMIQGMIREKAAVSAMFAMLAHRQGKWKIICMSLPK
jgi:hypothetical protein